MNGARIRRAGEGDTGAVYELICDMEAQRLPRPEFGEIFSRQLADGDYRCLIAELDGEAVGVLNMRLEYQLHHAGRIAEVMELAVAPGHRGRGLGARLLAEAERIALENCCVQIELACNRLRTNAHRFYEREGMKNFHCKFSKPLVGGNAGENRLGR